MPAIGLALGFERVQPGSNPVRVWIEGRGHGSFHQFGPPGAGGGVPGTRVAAVSVLTDGRRRRPSALDRERNHRARRPLSPRGTVCAASCWWSRTDRLTLTPLPATCWAYSATASKQSRQWCKTQLYAARRPERAPPPVFGGIDCGDASSRLCCAAAAHSTANLSNISRCLGLSVCSAASMQCRTNQS